jgi:hypothetical protein
VKPANRRLWLRETRRQGPVGGEQVGRCDGAALPEVADILVGKDPRGGPREHVAAVHFDTPLRSGINPRPDGRAVQGGEVRPAPKEPTEVARQGADVIAAADGEAQPAVARQVVGEPAGFVQVHA